MKYDIGNTLNLQAQAPSLPLTYTAHTGTHSRAHTHVHTLKTRTEHPPIKKKNLQAH